MTNPAPVRWGILGAAKIAREFVAPALHLSQRGVIAAVGSRDLQRAAALAAPYGDVALHGSYEALIADPGVDAVYIPLPNDAHVEWTERALDAGKHVLCEKPIALAAAEIDRLIAARDRSGRVAAEAFMVASHPQWARAREILASGELGRLHLVDAVFTFFNDDPGNIRNMAGAGGGALRDIGVYPTVCARLATGAEPVIESAKIEWEAGIDATAHAAGEIAGAEFRFTVSMRMAKRQHITFHGEDGWMTFTAPFNANVYGEASLEIRDNSGKRRSESWPGVDHYLLQADAMAAAVLDGAPSPFPLESSRANQQVIDAIYAAAR